MPRCMIYHRLPFIWCILSSHSFSIHGLPPTVNYLLRLLPTPEGCKPARKLGKLLTVEDEAIMRPRCLYLTHTRTVRHASGASRSQAWLSLVPQRCCERLRRCVRERNIETGTVHTWGCCREDKYDSKSWPPQTLEPWATAVSFMQEEVSFIC